MVADATIVPYHTDHILVFSMDNVKRTHRQLQGAPQKATDSFVLGILSGPILDTNPRGAAWPCKQIRFRYDVFGQTVGCYSFC